MCCPRRKDSISPGHRIVVAGGMWSVGLVPKARYIRGMDDITPMSNVDAFPGKPFGWFCLWPVSLLTWWNVPLLALLNVGRCERF